MNIAKGDLGGGESKKKEKAKMFHGCSHRLE
jgi:hypothetical protein